jgi:hypothetical protein
MMLTCLARGPPCSSRPADPCSRIAAGSCADNVAANTYPSKAHRYSYARRTAAERTNATIKDPARTDVSRGWCRLMGLAPITVFIACALVVRNMRVIDSFEARREDDARRMRAGMEPQTRRRRRRTLTDLLGASATPP